jgi:asparagine synthase (glutamine-hydrolysing)
MCGICGQVRYDGARADEAAVLRMRDRLRHRGPDDEGIWTVAFDGGGVSLGHTRLSILDLSSAGRQPMHDSTGRYCIVYNGEVYNYVELRKELEKGGSAFRTQTDTEVVLAGYAAWGPSCLERFVGMFSLAVWDSREQRLFCARDRLGIKPFYYFIGGGCFWFASEIKALLESGAPPARPDENLVYDYLSFCLIDHSARTFFDGVSQLEPGTSAYFSRGGFSAKRYWSFDSAPARKAGDEVEQFRELFYDSVKLRLRSDVPVGILLSGGLDSSSISRAAADALSPDKPLTFSSTLKGGGVDETQYSDSVARHIGARNTLLQPSGGAFWDELDAMLYAQDEPVHAADIYANWCMMRAVSGQGIKVLLNGQGGDELFGGYGWYVKNLLSSHLLHGNIAAFVRELRALKKKFSVTMTASYASILANVAEALLPARIKRPLKQELAGMAAISKPPFLRAGRGRDIGNIGLVNATRFEKKTKNDILYFNVPHYLHYEDRNSMHFSIEERVPFLDHRLVEWASRLPLDFKIRNGVTKYIVRRAFQGKLPDIVVNRTDKRGLSIPVETWMHGELRLKFSEFFRQDCRIYDRWIDRTRFLDHFGRYLDGRRTPVTRLMWRLFSLEKWCRLFFA